MPRTDIREHFVNGLAPDERVFNNIAFLEEARKAKVSQFGIVSPTVFPDGVTGLSAGQGWPFPQYFRGDSITLALCDDKLYSVNESTYAATQIVIYEPEQYSTEHISSNLFSSGVGWTTSSGWTISGGLAVRATASASSLTQSSGSLATAFVAGKLYNITLDITALSAEGSLRIGLGASNSSWVEIREAGVFQISMIGAVGDFTIQADAAIACSITSVTVRQILSIDALGLSDTSPAFHFVDYKDIWFLTNGELTMFCAPGNRAAGAVSPNLWRVVGIYDDAMRFNAMADVAGRLYIGGFDGASARFSETTWDVAWQLWLDKERLNLTHESMTIDSSTVFCCTPNGGDYHWPFATELGLFGIPDGDEARDFYYDSIRKGIMTFFRTPLRGDIIRIAALGGNAVVYTTDGVAIASPRETEAGIVHDVRRVARFGLLAAGALLPAPEGHYFIDANEGSLWFLSLEGGLQRLRYSWLTSAFKTAVATDMVLSCYDPIENDAFFSNGALGYVKTPTGLFETTILPTSLVSDNISTFGPTYDVTGSDTKTRIITKPMDFAMRDLKMIHSLEIGSNDVTNLRARLHYQTDGNTTWRVSTWVDVIAGGFTVPLVSAFTFKLELEYDAGDDARIEYVSVYWESRTKQAFKGFQRTI